MTVLAAVAVAVLVFAVVRALLPTRLGAPSETIFDKKPRPSGGDRGEESDEAGR
jgi:hypothetical protein